MPTPAEVSVPAGGYDGAGDLLTLVSNVPAAPSGYSGTTTYEYDARGQLLQEQSTRNGMYTNTFAYDDGVSTGPGNPTTFLGTSGFDFNSDNQFTESNYTYDGEGNPTTYKGTAATYDVEDRMTGYGSAMTATYTGSGLRASKSTSAGTTYFLYDGATPFVEMNSSGTVTAANTFGPTGLLSRTAGSSSTFYTFDTQGSAAVRLNSSAGVIGASQFDAYGNRIASTDSSTDPYSGFGAQMGYYTDAETGLQLLSFRYYDPSAGRFVNRDPIGYLGGLNVYRYAGNNPVNRFDPLGLDDGDAYLPSSATTSTTSMSDGLNSTGAAGPMVEGAVDVAQNATIGALTAPIGGEDAALAADGSEGAASADAASADAADSADATSAESSGESQAAKNPEANTEGDEDPSKPNFNNFTNGEISKQFLNAKVLFQLWGRGVDGAQAALADLEQNGARPIAGLTPQMLNAYKEIATRQISSGLDSTGVVTARLQLVQTYMDDMGWN